MSDPSNQDLDRRRFLAGGVAAAGLAAAMTADAAAGSQLEPWASAPRVSLLLHDPGLPMPPEVQRRLDANRTRVIALKGDPVWFWRSAAGAQLRDPATQLMGVTGWAELLVFRGLAAETRRHLRYEKLAGDGTFIWLIA